MSYPLGSLGELASFSHESQRVIFMRRMDVTEAREFAEYEWMMLFPISRDVRIFLSQR
jgi:hypothetical protein